MECESVAPLPAVLACELAALLRVGSPCWLLQTQAVVMRSRSAE